MGLYLVGIVKIKFNGMGCGIVSTTSYWSLAQVSLLVSIEILRKGYIHVKKKASCSFLLRDVHEVDNNAFDSTVCFDLQIKDMVQLKEQHQVAACLDSGLETSPRIDANFGNATGFCEYASCGIRGQCEQPELEVVLVRITVPDLAM